MIERLDVQDPAYHNRLDIYSAAQACRAIRSKSGDWTLTANGNLVGQTCTALAFGILSTWLRTHPHARESAHIPSEQVLVPSRTSSVISLSASPLRQRNNDGHAVFPAA
jgi:hypothetical protein